MPTTTKFNIADAAAVSARVRALDKRSPELKARVAQTLKELWNPQRDLVHVDDFAAFNDLYAQFPNFSEVIEHWETNAIALARLGLPFQAEPCLLIGSPGLGKTYFSKEVARVLSLAYFELSMATTTANFVISGSNLTWDESTPGFIARSLASSRVANPIFLLDELDKATGGRGYDPLGPLYPLLETDSARHFRDEALEFGIDASRVIWVATANEFDRIPDPILSRMRIFDIHPPLPEHMPLVARSIYTNIRAHQPYGPALDAVIDDRVVDQVCELTPRLAKRAIETACMTAIRAGRSHLIPSDIQTAEARRNRHGIL